MTYLLGIDIGTTGVKVLLIDDTGNTAASEHEEYPMSCPRPGWAEQDANLWWAATTRATQRLTQRKICAPSDIAAVSLSGQMHGLVPLDSAGVPVRPAILWCDQRPVAECGWLEQNFGAQLLDIACNPPLAGFTLPKILWMKNNEPRLFNRAASILLPKDYIRYRLAGEMAIDISDASGTLMLDVEKGVWAEGLIRDIGINPKLLPPVVGSDAKCGTVTAGAARETGLPQGLLVIAGGADNTCAAVGTGIVSEGRVSSSVGSSGVIFAHSDILRKDPLGRVHSFNHSAHGAFYMMGVMLSAGLSFKWFRDNFAPEEKKIEAQGGEDAYSQLTALAADAPPGSEDLLFLPYLNGERTPHRDPFARGAYFGISLRHERKHLVRALMEGITFGLKDSLDIVAAQGISVTEIRAAGGGGKSAFWRQLQADIFGAPVLSLKHDEGPALGAAILAGVGAGVFADIVSASDAIVKVESSTAPRPEMTALYAAAHERYRALYPAVRDLFLKHD